MSAATTILGAPGTPPPIAQTGGAAGGMNGPLGETKLTQTTPQFNNNAPLSQTNAMPGQNYYNNTVSTGLIPKENQLSNNTLNSLDYGLTGNGSNSANPSIASGIVGPNTLNTNNPMTQAIQNQQQKSANIALQGIIQQNAANAPVQQSAQQAQQANQIATVYQNQVQNYNQQAQYENQRLALYNQWVNRNNAAQASLYGAILSGTGTLAGVASASGINAGISSGSAAAGGAGAAGTGGAIAGAGTVAGDATAADVIPDVGAAIVALNQNSPGKPQVK